MRQAPLDFFDLYLQLPSDELAREIGGLGHFAPDQFNFLINPRRLRGSDFLMRWAQGRWSEDIVVRTLNQTRQYGVIPYGPSTVAPEDPAELEMFFEKWEWRFSVSPIQTAPRLPPSRSSKCPISCARNSV